MPIAFNSFTALPSQDAIRKVETLEKENEKLKAENLANSEVEKAILITSAVSFDKPGTMGASLAEALPEVYARALKDNQQLRTRQPHTIQ